MRFGIINFLTFLGFFLTPFIALKADIVTIKQDGTGDYTTIEAGMNESNISDTILVWPGVYFENLYYYGKHITVASLYAINSDPWFIKNTIIDGSQFTGSCVTMNYGDDDMIINGFTIRNGTGVNGGGITISEASGIVSNCIIESNVASNFGGGIYVGDTVSGIISNCIIKNNISSVGGGIYTKRGTLYISGTTIKQNYAKGMGGGIYCGYQSQIQFDQTNKCNLYLNYGAPGADYGKFIDVPPQLIVVDTCTVENPGTFFIASYDINGYPANDVTIQYDHTYLEEVDHDLYVNPVTGDDSNSGTSSTDPLKTVAFASILIKSDSLNPHNIFLSNGLYSPSKSNEKLPFCFKSYISLIGESMDSTIIDADSLSYLLMGLGYKKNFSMENITFQHGKGGIYIFNNDLVSITNVTLKNSFNSAGFVLNNIDSLIIKNTIVENLKGGFAFSIGCWFGNNTSFMFENVIIDHNEPGLNSTYSSLRGGGIEVIVQSQSYPSELGHGILSNVQITNNVRRFEPESPSDITVALMIYGYYKIDLINSTIAGNILSGTNGPMTGYGTWAISSTELNVYNSNLYNNSLKELLLGYIGGYGGDPSTCRVYYSDLKGGQDDVMNWNNYNTLIWGPGNIDNDPLWDTAAVIPYALPWNSPCANTGTPMYEFGMQPPYIIQEDTIYKLITFDYDTIVLPPTDLAGNPRIVGERIDMGAYECQDTTTGVNPFKVQGSKFKVTVYPNPFYANTVISFNLDRKAKVEAIIHDMNGNQIKKLMDASLPVGEYNMEWGGDDDNGEIAINGTYLVSVYINGKIAAAEKVVKKGK